MKKIKVWFYHGDLEIEDAKQFNEGNIGLLDGSDSFEAPFLYGPDENTIYEFNYVDTSIKMGFRPEHERKF